MKFLLLFAMISSAYAQDDCPPHGVSEFQEIQAIVSHVDPLSWWSANPEDIQAAFCRRGVPSDAEMEALIQEKTASRPLDKRIHDFRLNNEPREMVKAFEELTTRKGQYGWDAATDPQINLQATYQLNPDCENARCALDKIFGPSLARKVLFLKLKYGFNASHLAFSNSRQITEAEIDDVLRTFGDLHPSMQELGQGKNQRLVPAPAADPARPNASADSGIILYPGWSAATPGNRQYMIFHEIAHNLSATNENADTGPEWIGFSNWVKLGDNWQMGADACKVSEYGTHTPHEDFAETITGYRYNPEYVKNKCPEKYNYIRDHIFRGVEYTSPEACQSSPPGF